MIYTILPVICKVNTFLPVICMIYTIYLYDLHSLLVIRFTLFHL